VTRLPFAARRLWDHDSVQFALGVERYDLAAHHPHPPGYPLYIAVLKVLAALGIDALHGMVALSILAAALGAGLMVPLTARLVAAVTGRGCVGAAGGPDAPGGAGAGEESAVETGSGAPLAAGVLAAALYVFNPLLWFYGELPLVYAVEGGMTVGLAYAAWRMADGRGAFLTGCAAFAVAGGVRPSTLALLLPLFLFGVWRAWRRGASLGTLAAGAALGAALGLAWLLPLLAAAGGYAAYQRIGRENFGALLPYTSILYGAGWRALAHNLTIMTKWFLQGLLPAAVALAVLWLPVPRRSRGTGGGGGAARGPAADPDRQLDTAGGPLDAAGRPRQAGTHPFDAALPLDTAGHRIAAGLRLLAGSSPFLVAWALPPMLFFALFHVTKAGYTLVYLPALLVAASLLAAPALSAAAVRAAGSAAPVEDRHIVITAALPIGPRAGAGGVRGLTAIFLAAATGAALFLFGADRRPEQPRALAIVRHEFNRHSIATFERDLDRLLAALRRFPPATTVLAAVELSGTGPGGPEAFLYPWQRHLQWYLPDYEVLHLVPEERLAFVTRGHHPFHREGPKLELPPGTRQLAIVLSGPTGDRFPLTPWPTQRIGTFYLVLIPFSGHLQLGPFTFIAVQRHAA
jgi:hypothetical protein